MHAVSARNVYQRSVADAVRGSGFVGTDYGSVARKDRPHTQAAEVGKDRTKVTGEKVRLNLDVSQEIAEFIENLARDNQTTKADVMKRAIALLKVAHDEKKRHRSMGFVKEQNDDVLETKIVGIL